MAYQTLLRSCATMALYSINVTVERLVAQGHTNREMAELLHISPKTVDFHRTNLMRKLDLHSRTELTRWALRRKLIT